MDEYIDYLINYYCNSEEFKSNAQYNDISLLCGLPGVMVVLLDYYEESPSEEVKGVIQKYVNETFEILDRSQYLVASYSSGLAGYGFFVSKVLKNSSFRSILTAETIEQLEDFLQEINEILEAQIDIDIKDSNLDILHGLLGVGLYFLERDNEILVNKILDYLNETKKSTSDGQLYWTICDNFSKYQTHINLGLAHGNMSVFYFLMKVRDKKMGNVEGLINGIIQFYDHNKQEISNEIVSFYPHYITYDDFLNKTHVATNSRLGWCYGDVGVSYILYNFFYAENNKEYLMDVFNLLCNRRVGEDEYFVIDDGFCHGSAGISIMFQLLYDSTKDNKLLDSSNFWLNNINIDHNIAQNNDSFDDISLLEGLAGVLFCFLLKKGYKMNLTKEVLFLN